MNLIEATQSRHTVKAFEPGYTLPQSVVDQLLAVLHNSPSSVNSQPWHYVVASTPEGRERIARSMQGQYAYNAPKAANASHVIALCMRTDVDEAHLEAVLAQEARDGRYKTEDAKRGQDRTRRSFVALHRYDLRDMPHWMEKQVYLALGGLLFGAAVLGVDATPLEGFDTGLLDFELGLRDVF